MNKPAMLFPVRRGMAYTRVIMAEWDIKDEEFTPLAILPMSWFYAPDDPIWIDLNEGKDVAVNIELTQFGTEDNDG